MKRFCMIQDNDCHWYVIPVNLCGKFQRLLDDGDKDEYAKFNETFGEFAIGGSPALVTFEKPRINP